MLSDGGSGGSLGLEFASSGTFNLRAANTYTGLTMLQDNAFVNLAFNSTSPAAPNANILASTGTLAFAGAGRLNLTGSASRTSSQTFAATNLLPGGFANLSLAPGTSGTAVLNLGTVTSTGGVIRLPDAAAAATSSVVTVGGTDRVLPFANFASGSFAALVSGTLRAATLTSGTFGVTTFSGTDNYIILSSGTLATSATANVLQVGASSQTTSYTLGLGTNELTVNAIRGLNNNASGGYTFNATTGRLRIGDSGRLVLGNQPGALGSMTFSAPISDSGATPGQLVLEPNTQNYNYGGITLSGSNTHSGGTVVTGSVGRFFIGHANALGTGTFTVGGNGIYLYASANNLTIAGNPQVWNSDFGFDGTNALNTGTGQVSLGDTASASGRRLVTVASTGEFRVTGPIVNGSDAVFPVTGLEKAGTGVLVLSASNAYTGPTRITAGALRFANRLAMYGGGTSAWTADNLTTTSGANLVVNVGGAGEFTDADIAMLAGLGTSTSGFLAGSFLGIDTTNVSSGTFLLPSQIANANAIGISKYGTGTLSLSGSNTLTGGVRVAAGRLLLPGPSSMGSGTGAVEGGILDLGGNTFSNAFSFVSGTLTNGSLALANLATSGSVTSTGTADVISATLTGTAGFTKLGSGTLALRGANTFTGRTRHDAGGLIFDSIANVSGTTPNSFGLPTLASSTIGLANLTLVYDGVGHTSDRVLDLTGNGAVTLNAAGVGTLALTSPMTISGTGARTITLTGSGAGSIGAIPNAANNTAVSLIKSGNGSWTLTGANTLTGTGNVRIDAGGPLIVAHPTPFASLTGTLAFNSLSPGGALALGPIASSTIAAPITLGGARFSSGGGTLVLSGSAQTIHPGGSGPFIVVNTVAAGRVAMGALTTEFNRNLKLYGNGNFDIGPISGTFAVSGTSTANGGFVIARGGTTRMTGNNTFIGQTNIHGGGGTLVLDYTVNNGSKLDDTSGLSLNAGTYGIQRSGGDIMLVGTPSAPGGEEVVARLTGNTINYHSGAWNLGRASGAGVLNVGAMATGVGGMMDFTSTLNIRGGGILKTTGTNVNGLLGRKAFVNGTDFATVDGSGFVQAYAGYTSLDLAANTSAQGATTFSLTGGGRITAAKAGWSLKIQNEGFSDVLDLNGFGLGLDNRATILYAGGGDGKYTITGTGGLNGGTDNSGVYVAENAELTLANSVWSPGQQNWIKAGPGTVVLAFRDIVSGFTSLEGVVIGEGVARLTNSNYLGQYAVASSPYGSAIEFAPSAGLGGITFGTVATWLIGGGGVAEGGALRSRFGENFLTGTITIQGLGARINADADRLTLSGNVVTRGAFESANEPGQLGNVTFGGAATILVNGTNNAGVGISGGGGVLKDGPGTLIVTATSTYTGTTAVTGGELVWGTRNAFYNADTTKWNPFNFTTGSGAAMSFRVGDAAGAFTDADIATLTQQGGETSGFVSGAFIGLDTSGASSGSYAYSGSITDTRGGLGVLGVAKSGTGTLTLTGTANTFTGGVLVRGGRLLRTGTNQIGTGVAEADGGLLDVNNQPITIAFSIRSGTIANATFDVSLLTAKECVGTTTSKSTVEPEVNVVDRPGFWL
ncbi:MAG: beta strand repeat-containing protein, partial [Planctomycetia bacterium]